MARVLGKDERDNIIILLEKEEAAKLAGFAGKWSQGFDEKSLLPGSNLKVSDIYTDAKTALENHSVAVDAAKRLRTAADKFLVFFQTESSRK